MSENNKYMTCECDEHALRVSDWDGYLTISIWEHAHQCDNGRLYWIKEAIMGNVFPTEIVLSKNDANNLINILQEFVDKENNA